MSVRQLCKLPRLLCRLQTPVNGVGAKGLLGRQQRKFAECTADPRVGKERARAKGQ
jgi:hypothetical protein